LNPAPPIGVYVHWPYCARICPYCDFNVRRDRDSGQTKTDLANAILADIRSQAELAGARTLVSIYFGGGTPSLMDPAVVARVIAQITAMWRPSLDLEITLEANPTDVEAGRFQAFAQAGVNRVSLGVQSLRDRTLDLLGRNHDAAAARRAVEAAGAVFARLSVDLIYAVPGQTMGDWACELREVVALGSEHISPYQLTIEPATAFAAAVRRGALRPPGPEPAADLFETTQTVLTDAGFEAYEISNHARTSAARSRHNLLYWRGEDYLGVGPGAHGRLTIGAARWEFSAAKGVSDYIARSASGGHGVRRRLDPHERALERLLMGLRTSEGVALADLTPLIIKPSKLDALADAGLVDLDDERIVARAAGRLVLDRIALHLVDGA